jgi:hypothetical protein
MTADAQKNETQTTGQAVTAESIKPKNPAAVKKAVALGKEMSRTPEITKVAVAMKMYELISDEPREIIVQAFVDGADLTPKGAQTYFYNCKRKAKKSD